MNLINCVLVNKVRRNSILGTHVYRGCRSPSDHKLVITKRKIKVIAHNNEKMGK